MCLFPTKIKNKKYSPTLKNIDTGIPEYKDIRQLWIEVPCGHCKECKKKKAREWQIRLIEDIKVNTNAKFVTLTFSESSLKNLTKELGLSESNAVAGLAIRKFTERWRKKHKATIRHWLITELGHPAKEGQGYCKESTERIHLHGFLWTNEPDKEIRKLWSYGNIYVGNYVNEKTVNYCVKYVNKMDLDHKGYEQEIFASKGIGKAYIDNPIMRAKHRFRGQETNLIYKFPNGAECMLPKYYKDKLFSEEERECLWLYALDMDTTYINGIKIEHQSEETAYKYMLAILETARQENKRLGYGDNTKEWRRRSYNVTKRWYDRQNNLKNPEWVKQKIEERAKKNAKLLESWGLYEENEV